MTDDLYSDVLDEELIRPDGRTVAWTRTGEGIPLLRLPGTPGSRWSIRADRTPWVERGLQELGAGHFEPYRREGDILDELLARG